MDSINYNENLEEYNEFLDDLQQEWNSLPNELIPEVEEIEEPILINQNIKE